MNLDNDFYKQYPIKAKFLFSDTVGSEIITAASIDSEFVS